MKIERQYRIPLAIAIALHVLLLILLCWRSTPNIPPLATSQSPIIHAEVVNAAELIKPKPKPVIPRLDRGTHKTKVIVHHKLKPKPIHHIVKVEQAKPVHIKKREKVEAQLATIKAEQKALMQKLMAAQVAKEAQALRTEQVKAKRLSELDRYKNEIVQAIENNWLIPKNTNKNLTCTFIIELMPNGQIENIRLVKSSGNLVLDRSARTAIYKAAPLPVPQNPSLFNQFRDIQVRLQPMHIQTISFH